MHCFGPPVQEKTQKNKATAYSPPLNDESYLSDFYLWVKFIKFVRGAYGPYSRQRKVSTNESLAIRAISLFGSRPPSRNGYWPLRETNRGEEFESSLKDLLVM